MKYILLTVTVLLFTACSTKMTIKAIKPSIVSDSDIKQISINSFKKDTIGLKNIIKEDMRSVKFNNKYYFTIVNRDISKTILKEQKLQDSGIVNNTKAIEGLSDVRAIVSGEITSISADKQIYYQKTTDYNRCLAYRYTKDKKKVCKKYRIFNKKCEQHDYNLDFIISINKVSNAQTIYERNFSRNKTIKRCDYSHAIKTKNQVFKDMARQISYLFIKDITPTYEYYKVEILKDEDIDYNNKEEKLLSESIKLIESKNIEVANKLLGELVYSTKEKSYVALYNYALTQEAMGTLVISLTNYNKARVIARKSKELSIIIKAISRVEKSMRNKEKANKQIN